MFFPTKSLRRPLRYSLLLALLAASCLPVEAGFPLRRIKPAPRVEGPIVPAPKNWGYRPTRWTRWENAAVHPPLGPIPPESDSEPPSKADDDAEPIETPPPVEQEGNGSSPHSLPDLPPLPPLPLDDGPPKIPANFDDDLPPLPGQPLLKTKPENRAPAPAEPQGEPAQKTVPDASGPQFRDPDSIFDKTAPAGSRPNGPQKPAAPLPEPESPLPTLPQAEKPEAKNIPLTPKQQTPPPTPATPKVDIEPEVKTETKPTPPPTEPDWIKRSDKKQSEEKTNGQKKKPFYDPDSIFDQKSSKTEKPDKEAPAKEQKQKKPEGDKKTESRWQPAGGKRAPQISSRAAEQAHPLRKTAVVETTDFSKPSADAGGWQAVSPKRSGPSASKKQPPKVIRRDYLVRPAGHASNMPSPQRVESEQNRPAAKIATTWQAAAKKRVRPANHFEPAPASAEKTTSAAKPAPAQKQAPKTGRRNVPARPEQNPLRSATVPQQRRIATEPPPARESLVNRLREPVSGTSPANPLR